MRWPRFVTKMGLSKIVKGLMTLALLKLCLLTFIGWQAVVDGPVSTVRQTQQVAQRAPQPAPQQAVRKVVEPARAHAQDAPAAAQSEAQPTEPPLGRDALMQKQEELDRRERDLNALEDKIARDMAELKKTRQQIERMLEDAKAIKNKRDKHLVEVFSNMKAKQAAQVLETMDERQAVKILSGMRGRQAGEILTYVNAKKAARLAEKLTRLQIPFE